MYPECLLSLEANGLDHARSAPGFRPVAPSRAIA